METPPGARRGSIEVGVESVVVMSPVAVPVPVSVPVPVVAAVPVPVVSLFVAVPVVMSVVGEAPVDAESAAVVSGMLEVE